MVSESAGNCRCTWRELRQISSNPGMLWHRGSYPQSIKVRLEAPATENKGYEQQERLERWHILKLQFLQVPEGNKIKQSELAELSKG